MIVQLAQRFATGGTLVAGTGTRPATTLPGDAGSFLVSAAVIRPGVHQRPAPNVTETGAVVGPAGAGGVAQYPRGVADESDRLARAQGGSGTAVAGYRTPAQIHASDRTSHSPFPEAASAISPGARRGDPLAQGLSPEEAPVPAYSELVVDARSTRRGGNWPTRRPGPPRTAIPATSSSTTRTNRDPVPLVHLQRPSGLRGDVLRSAPRTRVNGNRARHAGTPPVTADPAVRRNNARRDRGNSARCVPTLVGRTLRSCLHH